MKYVSFLSGCEKMKATCLLLLGILLIKKSSDMKCFERFATICTF